MEEKLLNEENLANLTDEEILEIDEISVEDIKKILSCGEKYNFIYNAMAFCIARGVGKELNDLCDELDLIQDFFVRVIDGRFSVRVNKNRSCDLHVCVARIFCCYLRQSIRGYLRKKNRDLRKFAQIDGADSESESIFMTEVFINDGFLVDCDSEEHEDQLSSLKEVLESVKNIIDRKIRLRRARNRDEKNLNKEEADVYDAILLNFDLKPTEFLGNFLDRYPNINVEKVYTIRKKIKNLLEKLGVVFKKKERKGSNSAKRGEDQVAEKE